ncbi:uncharacterized protein LOC142322244 isoform X2 [Lycorma delicatula]|uniref:uncharacterized protein LOC142322244 isoform X2 n=1 Tax=Lycorma delicatula TaxID=130591 RepID=UPI003F50FCB7
MGKTLIRSFLMVVAGLVWVEITDGDPEWRQGGPWIDRGEQGGAVPSWGSKFEGGPSSYGQPAGCNRCTVLQNGPPGPAGPSGSGGGGGFGGSGGAEKHPPDYRGNGYDNFSPEWKLREVLQQQGSGAAPLGQVAAGGWKKEVSNSGGSWSGTIRPIDPNWGPARGPEPPSSPGSSWGIGGEIKVSSQGWADRGHAPRKIDEPFRVTSGGGGGVGGNWVRGASGWNKGGGGGPTGPSSASYQGGGHGGYHEFDANKVSGQSLTVQSGFRPWDASRQPGFSGWDNSGRGPGDQDQAGLPGWGSGLGHSRNWEYGRPVEPQPEEPFAPREPNINSPPTDPRWSTRGPSWGFRDPPFGSETREPGWNSQNPNWNKVSSDSLTVSSGYGPDPPSPQKETPWGSKGGYPVQGSQWPSRGPPPHQYPSFATKDPSYGGSGRRPGVGCRDLGCGSPAAYPPRGPPQWGPPAAHQPPSGGGGGGGGGGWGYRDREPPRQPSWRPSGGGGGSGGGGRDPYWADRQPPPGAPSGFRPGSVPGQHSGYPPPSGPPQGQGYPPQSGAPCGGPPPMITCGGAQGGQGYGGPPIGQGGQGYGGPPIGQGGQSYGGPSAGQGYAPQGGPPQSQGYPPSSGGYDSPPHGASGYQPGGQGAGGYQPGGQGAGGYQPGGQGASGYQPGGQGASGYQPGGQGAGGGPGASGYPPNSQQFDNNPPRRYNGHSGVGATLDFPGLNAYVHDTSHHGSYSHCNNGTATSSPSEHSHSSTSAPTSTMSP